jgi:succinate dehydrogenase/fumarate reductase-like Fe-S protein
MDRKKINAYFIIIILFFWHIIKKFLFKLKRNDISKFRENYYPEYLIEIPEESYLMLSKFENCINCSLCDAYCSKLSTLHRDGLPQLSEMILANSSSLEEFRFSYNELDIFEDCNTCSAPCISVCPNEYPIFDLIKIMNNYNIQLNKKVENLEENNE